MAIACPDCGLLQRLPALPRRATAFCTRCHTNLETTNGRSIEGALACSLATLLLLFPVNMLPLIRMHLFSLGAENVIANGVLLLWSRRWLFLAGLSLIFVVLLPFVRFGLLTIALAVVRLGRRPSWLGPVFRWAVWLDLWAMLDVFLL